MFHDTGIFLACLSGTRESLFFLIVLLFPCPVAHSLSVQQSPRPMKICPIRARYSRVARSLPSLRTPFLVPSPTPYSDPPSGRPLHIDKTVGVIFAVSVSRGMVGHHTPFSPLRPPQARIRIANSTLYHITLCNINLHICRWRSVTRAPSKGNTLHDTQRFVSTASLLFRFGTFI